MFWNKKSPLVGGQYMQSTSYGIKTPHSADLRSEISSLSSTLVRRSFLMTRFEFWRKCLNNKRKRGRKTNASGGLRIFLREDCGTFSYRRRRAGLLHLNKASRNLQQPIRGPAGECVSSVWKEKRALWWEGKLQIKDKILNTTPESTIGVHPPWGRLWRGAYTLWLGLSFVEKKYLTSVSVSMSMSTQSRDIESYPSERCQQTVPGKKLKSSLLKSNPGTSEGRSSDHRYKEQAKNRVIPINWYCYCKKNGNCIFTCDAFYLFGASFVMW